MSSRRRGSSSSGSRSSSSPNSAEASRSDSATHEASGPDLQLATWCVAIRRADPRAFEAFFRATHGGLTRFADSLVRDSAVAADLVQEAYARLWERRADLDPTRSIKALVYRTVRNLAYNRARDRRTRADLLAEHTAGTPLATGVSASPLPDAKAEAKALDARLQAWIADLPDRQREALTLSRFDGLSHAEIADVMGVSPRTVNNHLVQALRTLRDRLHHFAPNLLNR